MLQDFEEVIVPGDVVTGIPCESLTTLYPSDLEMDRHRDCYSGMIVCTTHNAPRFIHGTPEDPPPINNFKKVTFDDYACEASTRFNISGNLLLDPDIFELNVTHEDHKYDGVIVYTAGDVFLIESCEPLIVPWDFSHFIDSQEPFLSLLDMFNIEVPNDSTLTAQDHGYEDPSVFDFLTGCSTSTFDPSDEFPVVPTFRMY